MPVTVPLLAMETQSDQLSRLAEAVEAIVRRTVANSSGDLYAELLRELKPLLEAQQLDAASFAADFYDWVREESIGEPSGAVPHTGIYADAFDHELQNLLRRTSDRSRIAERVVEIADRHMMQAYVNTMLNAARKELKNLDVRFARVTRGDSHVCDFCDMLSSRGWVYLSSKSATSAGAMGLKRYHARCRCIAVPGWGTYEVGPSRRMAMFTEIEGYDPEAAFERYLQNDRWHGIGAEEMRARRRARRDRESWQVLTPKGIEEWLKDAPTIADLQWKREILLQKWREYEPERYEEEAILDLVNGITMGIYKRLLEAQEPTYIH